METTQQVSDGSLRQCRTCKRYLPATPEYFNKGKFDGFYHSCRDCRKAYREANKERIAEKDRRYREANADKVRAKSKAYYWQNREACIQKARAYHQEHREQILTDRREQRQQNPGKYREADRQKYLRHKPHIQAYYSAWREGKRQHLSTYQRQWKQVNRDKVRAVYHRREARKLNLPDGFTADDWRRCLEYWRHRCAVCGRPAGLWHTLAADHWIPLASPNCPGTVPTNIVPLCNGLDGCNTSKQDIDAAEWLTRKFGKAKARRVLARIAAYFDHLRILLQDKS